jgi:hypothetical protein
VRDGVGVMVKKGEIIHYIVNNLYFELLNFGPNAFRARFGDVETGAGKIEELKVSEIRDLRKEILGRGGNKK